MVIFKSKKDTNQNKPNPNNNSSYSTPQLDNHKKIMLYNNTLKCSYTINHFNSRQTYHVGVKGDSRQTQLLNGVQRVQMGVAKPSQSFLIAGVDF